MLNKPRGPKGTPLRVAECIVGDETGIVVFTARNEQGRSFKSLLDIKQQPNAFIRTAVDKALLCAVHLAW